MSTLIQRYGKTLGITIMSVLVVAAVAVGSAAALGASDPTPPRLAAPLSALRLEVAWARLQAGHDRAAVMLQFADQRTTDVQNLIAQAKASGRDVTGLQNALNTLESALQQAQPIFDSTTSTFRSHPGFDASGRVTDSATALQTVTELAAKDKQIQGIINPAQQAFQQALNAFRQSGGLANNAAEASNLRLELAWARLQAEHSRLQALFNFADQRLASAQQLLDAAKARGKDVSAVETAQDNMETAIKQARPIFESTNGVMASHPGFDSSGNVTNAGTALQTVKGVAATYQQIGSVLKPAQQAFQDALRQFRQNNAPVPASPTPSS